MGDFKYLVVQFDRDEDGPFTNKWLCHSLEEARHLVENIYGYTTIYKLEEVR